MSRTTRALAAATAAAALTLTVTGPVAVAAPTGHAVSADAKPAAKPAKPAKGKAAAGQRQLLRDLDRAVRALDRAVKPSRIAPLSETSQAGLLANIGTEKTGLVALRATLLAADTTADVRQVRADLRGLRIANYVVAVNQLRQAQALAVVAAADVEATTLVASAVTKALTVTAAADKSLLADVRADLNAARALLGIDDAEPVVE